MGSVIQSCLPFCDPMDCSLPGSSVHVISQARILEWVAVSFSRGSSQSRDWQVEALPLSHLGSPIDMSVCSLNFILLDDSTVSSSLPYPQPPTWGLYLVGTQPLY